MVRQDTDILNATRLAKHPRVPQGDWDISYKHGKLHRHHTSTCVHFNKPISKKNPEETGQMGISSLSCAQKLVYRNQGLCLLLTLPLSLILLPCALLLYPGIQIFNVSSPDKL